MAGVSGPQYGRQEIKHVVTDAAFLPMVRGVKRIGLRSGNRPSGLIDCALMSTFNAPFIMLLTVPTQYLQGCIHSLDWNTGLTFESKFNHTKINFLG